MRIINCFVCSFRFFFSTLLSSSASLFSFSVFQIIVDYKHDELDLVLKALNTMPNHLTAGVVSNDIQFNNKVLGETITGTMCVVSPTHPHTHTLSLSLCISVFPSVSFLSC